MKHSHDRRGKTMKYNFDASSFNTPRCAQALAAISVISRFSQLTD